MFQIKMGKFWKKNTSRSQFKCCENNIETTSMLFQNDPPAFASSSKISPNSCVSLSHTIECITNNSVG